MEGRYRREDREGRIEKGRELAPKGELGSTPECGCLSPGIVGWLRACFLDNYTYRSRLCQGHVDYHLIFNEMHQMNYNLITWKATR